MRIRTPREQLVEVTCATLIVVQYYHIYYASTQGGTIENDSFPLWGYLAMCLGFGAVLVVGLPIMSMRRR